VLGGEVDGFEGGLGMDGIELGGLALGGLELGIEGI
jgi:hypothetical protein